MVPNRDQARYGGTITGTRFITFSDFIRAVSLRMQTRPASKGSRLLRSEDDHTGKKEWTKHTGQRQR